MKPMVMHVKANAELQEAIAYYSKKGGRLAARYRCAFRSVLERFSFDRIVGIKPEKWDRHRSSLARASPIFLDRSIQKKTALAWIQMMTNKRKNCIMA